MSGPNAANNRNVNGLRPSPFRVDLPVGRLVEDERTNTVQVTFSNVLRKRPLVLTEHEVCLLSSLVGRNVLPELQAICGERYAVKTLGQLMRTLTAMLSSQRQHIGSADCWCSPTVEFKDPVSGTAVWVHKQVQ